MLALVVGPTFPGRANHDTDQMVREMAAGAYTDWWSPLLMMAWKPFYMIGLGLGFIQIGQVAAFFVSVGSLLRPAFTRRSAAITATVLVCLFPTTYAMLINVIRDTWFAVATIAALAVVFRTRRPTPVHGALLALGLGLMAAARQNGIVVVVIVAGAAAIHWGVAGRGSSRRRKLAVGALAGIATGLLFFGLVQGLLVVTSVERTGPEAVTFYVDLDEMSTRVGTVLVPDVYIRDSLTLDDLRADRNYQPYSVRDLVRLRLPSEDRSAAAVAWREAVTEYPFVYFQARWQLFTRQIGWSGVPAEAYYATYGTSRDFAPRSRWLSSRSTSYLSMFDDGDKSHGGFLHRPWPYLAVAVVAAVRFGRRWPLLWSVPASQAGVLLGLFFLSPISEVRMAYAVFVLGIISGVYAFAGPRVLLERDLHLATRVAGAE
ncbi:MAG: hypothetical protein RJB61_262 [Actinomycetota bacterium]